MIKLVYCVRRRADIADAEFHRYWLEDHGPLVRRWAQAIRARKYIQSHTCAPALNDLLLKSRGLAAPYDGITEVWWDDEASCRTGFEGADAAEAHRALLEDEAKFIDFGQSRVFMTEEHVIFDYTR